MVGLQTLDLAIGVRVPASQPKSQRRHSQSIDKLPLRFCCNHIDLAVERVAPIVDDLAGIDIK